MIATVVVTHAGDHVRACIRSVRDAGGSDRLIVVDNGAALRPLPDDVDVVRVANRGFGAAANAGFRRALAEGATAVALLNDDVEVAPGWLPPLVAELADPTVGAAQPAVLIAGSSPPLVNSLGVVIGRDGAGTDVGDGQPVDRAAEPATIERFTGAAVLFRDEYLHATGGFDERYFLYYEDADLGARGAALGWRYRVVPESVVWHGRGATTTTLGARTRYLQERNRLWHAFRHSPRRTCAGALWLSLRRLRHAPRGVHARALLAGVAGAPGACWRRARHETHVGGLR